MKAGIRGIVKGAKVGILVGLSLAVLYVAIGMLGTTEFNKSLGFSLLVVGFPTIFAIVPAVQWLGVQGGAREGIAIVLLTLSLNGAVWGAIIGAAVGLGLLGQRNRPGRRLGRGAA